MKKPDLRYILGILLSFGVLGFMLLITHAFLYEAPYTGFYFNGTDGRIVEFYDNAAAQGTLQVGDILKEVNGVSYLAHQADGTIHFFEGVQPGETVPVTVTRNGDDVETTWTLSKVSTQEFNARFRNPWWLGYIFWVVGLAVQLFLRPRDTLWRLLIAFNEVTGAWFLFGVASSLHTWNSSILLRAVTWIALPIYLHLHRLFPSPLKRLPSWVGLAFYLFCGALALGEIFQLLPKPAYFIGVLSMFGGSIILLFHRLRHPQDRRAVVLLLLTFGVALLPGILLSLSGLGGSIPESGVVGMLALPLVPAAYAFLIARRQSGGIEARASKFVAIYGFLILLGSILTLLSGQLADVSPIITFIVVGLLAAYISIVAFPAFQIFINRRLMGVKLPYQNLLETYSARIATSASTASLLQLLEEDVFPSLLVKQYAFVQLTDDAPRVILVRGVDANQLPNLDDAPALTSLAGRFLLPDERRVPSWLRLILTLRAGEETLGFFLLGRRDPDDLYHADELPIFQSLADQTAIAMSNLLQEERLRSLYQSDIQRREQERLSLARELHDSVLNQLAALRMNLGDTTPSPRFEQAYAEVVQRLREIVSDLRPPMLNYGLKLALEEHSQTLMERSENKLQVSLALIGDDQRYLPNVELHLFRIVQEACENALHHANASNIVITAQMDAQKVIIEIKDDGVGFEMGERMDLNELLIHKHFGLAGIIERANLIETDASIQSAPETGTRVRVVWRAPLNGQE